MLSKEIRMRKIILALFLTGCMVGPNYKPPENEISEKWQENYAKKELLVSNKEPEEEWWKVFKDPLLDKYIEMASKHNKDILTAEANIVQARGLREVAASKLFPQIFLDLNGKRTDYSKNGSLFATGGGLLPIPKVQNLFNALFDAAWELDIFGKTRRQVEAAEATIGSKIEQKNDILISVMAEVARNYMEIRSEQRKVQLLEDNINLLEQNVKVVKEQVKDGYSNRLNLENIEASLFAAKSALPNSIAQIYKGIYTVSILIGEVPETLVEELIVVKPLPKAPFEVSLGIRSDLLRRRPDVRQAERNLAVATANVGVAVASFYPTITLSANMGLQALKIRDLFKASSKTWFYGGDFNLPIFEGGKLVGNLKANRAVASAIAYTYQQTVLTALKEAETALVTYSEDLSSSLDLQNNTEKIRKVVELTTERYDRGLVNVIDVLNSKQNLISSESSLLTKDTQSLLDLITLYKALGGGWRP